MPVKGSVIREHLIFSGAVQGVGFRYRARRAAEAFGVTGWVRNDWSGTVSMELQGSRGAIEQVLAAIERGLYVRVESVERRAIPVEPEERGFVTREG